MSRLFCASVNCWTPEAYLKYNYNSITEKEKNNKNILSVNFTRSILNISEKEIQDKNIHGVIRTPMNMAIWKNK
jgi:hypothetical protein